MKIIWTEDAKFGLSQIGKVKEGTPKRFSDEETQQYKKKLRKQVNEQIAKMGTSMPSKYERWKGCYKVQVNNYLAFYLYDEDEEVYYVVDLVHGKQIR